MSLPAELSFRSVPLKELGGFAPAGRIMDVAFIVFEPEQLRGIDRCHERQIVCRHLADGTKALPPADGNSRWPCAACCLRPFCPQRFRAWQSPLRSERLSGHSSLRFLAPPLPHGTTSSGSARSFRNQGPHRDALTSQWDSFWCAFRDSNPGPTD